MKSCKELLQNLQRFDLEVFLLYKYLIYGEWVTTPLALRDPQDRLEGFLRAAWVSRISKNFFGFIFKEISDHEFYSTHVRKNPSRRSSGSMTLRIPQGERSLRFFRGTNLQYYLLCRFFQHEGVLYATQKLYTRCH
jgi:hypothetical protein